MAEITVTSSDRDPAAFDVGVTAGGKRTAYRVTVPEDVRARFASTAPEDLVRASFEFLLEREPPRSILPEFSLSVISRYFPEYLDDLASRLG